MTKEERDEAIELLSSKKEAYIINIDGEPTICYSAKRIKAMEMAIRSFEAWDKVINTLKNWSDAKVSPKQRDVYFDCIELIEQTIKWEVTDNLPGAEMAVKNDKKIRGDGMTRSEQKYQKAIKMLMEEYRKAQAQAFVRKPMAYALYQVWKWFDENEKPRFTKKEDAEC